MSIGSRRATPPTAGKGAFQGRPHKVGFVSLGCAKALVDSERILTQLRAEGYEVTPTYAESDIVIVNTCGFIEEAVEESLDAIADAVEQHDKVVVTGCLGARAEVIRGRFPDLLAVTGPHSTQAVLDAVHRELPPHHDPFLSLLPPGGIKLTPRHYAYLKISEGCNHGCRFCIIPQLRGSLVSRPIDEVMEEAENLVTAGVRELLVVSQDTSAYGVDIKYRTQFHRNSPLKTDLYDLARSLGSLGVWVRLHYVYPYPHVDRIIPLMRDGYVLPYLDIPFQHASPRILKLMRRPASAQRNLDRIFAWRDVCSDITIRSTFIVGFPGETEAEFAELLQFLEDAELDRVGCFAYSPVSGAAANELPDAVPDAVRNERRDRLMAVQAEISERKLQRKIGRTVSIILDEVDGTHGIGRSEGDAPDVDGRVIVDNVEGAVPGDILEVVVTGADQYDLHAVAQPARH